MLQCWGEGTVILNRVTSIRHIEKVKFLQRLEGNRVNDNNEKHFKINSAKALSLEYMGHV